MHFPIFTITSDPPTELVLNAVLAPFYCDKLDWHTLGGRYSGLLIPHRDAETMSGGCRAPEWEQRLDFIDQLGGGKTCKPGQSGPGVDALRIGDLKDIHLRGAPSALVMDDKWHAGSPCPNLQAIEMGSRYGLLADADIKKMISGVDANVLQRERDAVQGWGETVFNLLCAVDKDGWLAVVDCHN
jgi:hypothetical protein